MMFWQTTAPERICSLRGARVEVVWEETIRRRGDSLGSLELVFSRDAGSPSWRSGRLALSLS